MNNNVSAFKSASNKYYSVMELYNGYDTDINLSGYYLSNKYDIVKLLVEDGADVNSNNGI